MNSTVSGDRVTPSGKLRREVRQALRRAKKTRRLVIVAAGLASLSTAPASASPFPAEFELSTLLAANGGDGSAGVAINGIDIVDSSSSSLRSAGDVNGDGIGDMLLSAERASPGGRSSAGEVYVVFGTDQGLSAEFELSTLLSANGGDGSTGFVLNGIDADDRAGVSVSGAGDLNDDGFDDLLIGASEADPANVVRAAGGQDQTQRGGEPPTRVNGGEVYVVFGTDQGFPAELELSTLLSANGGDGSAGFVLKGAFAGDRAGSTVAAAGDINQDGIADIVIGAGSASPGPSRSGAGQSYVVFGTASGFPAEFELSSLLSANGGDGSVGFVLNGNAVGDSSGKAFGAGDINGDGFSDLVIGADRATPGGHPGGRYDAGQTYVFFGTDQAYPAEFELSSLLAVNGGDGSAGVVLQGIDNGDESGASLGVCDVNGDGFADVLMGAADASPGGRNRAGQSYLVFGSDQGFPAEMELSALLAGNGGDGSAGVALNGIDEEDAAGIAVDTLGDFNGDGFCDLLIGAYYASGGGRPYSGESYVVFGSDLAFAAEIELSTLLASNGGDGSVGFVLNGVAEDDYSGRPVSAAGDINGDGLADLMISAQDADPGARTRAGQTYVVLGRGVDTDGDGIIDVADNCTLIANPDQCDTNGDGFGNHCDPDLNNNGVVNFDDLAALKAAIFSNPASGNWNADADLNCNDVVNFTDLGTMKAFIFGPPGPSGTAP